MSAVLADLSSVFGWERIAVAPEVPQRALPQARTAAAVRASNHPSLQGVVGDDYRGQPRRGRAEMAEFTEALVKLLETVDEEHALKASDIAELCAAHLTGVAHFKTLDGMTRKRLTRLHAKGRVGRRVIATNSNGQPTYGWYGLGVTTGQAPQPPKGAYGSSFTSAEYRPKVLALLANGPATSPDMRARFGIRVNAQATFDRMLRQMRNDGLIVQFHDPDYRAALWRLP
jgi:hypothetical protein